MTKGILKYCIIVCAVLAAGCGGSDSSPTIAPKYAQLTFSLISSSQPPIEAYSVALTLPQGVSVPIKAGTENELESPKTIYVTNGGYVQGTYSSSIRQVKFSGGKSGDMGYGSFAVINCLLSPSAGSLVTNDFPYTMSGVTLNSGSTIFSDITQRSRLDLKLLNNL